MDFDGVYWPTIGKHIPDMFVCQPPIHRLLVKENCPLDDSDLYGDRPGFQITSNTSLTLRDLYSVAEKLLQFHDDCRTPGGYAFCCFSPGLARVTINYNKPSDDSEWDNATDYTARCSESWQKYYANQWTGGVFDNRVLADCIGPAGGLTAVQYANNIAKINGASSSRSGINEGANSAKQTDADEPAQL